MNIIQLENKINKLTQDLRVLEFEWKEGGAGSIVLSTFIQAFFKTNGDLSFNQKQYVLNSVNKSVLKWINEIEPFASSSFINTVQRIKGIKSEPLSKSNEKKLSDLKELHLFLSEYHDKEDGLDRIGTLTKMLESDIENRKQKSGDSLTKKVEEKNISETSFSSKNKQIALIPKNSKSNIHHSTMLSKLKKDEFVDAKTNLKQLNCVFSGEKHDIIKWTGTTDEFHTFIDLIGKKLEEKPKKIWQIALSHFDVYNKLGAKVNPTQIKDSTNKIASARKTLLSTITSYLD